MTKRMKKYLMMIVAVMCIVGINVNGSSTMKVYASTKSNADNALKEYKKGNYSKAKKYFNKTSSKYYDKSRSRMSDKMKNAYRTVLKKTYKLNNWRSSKYLVNAYFNDLDGDKNAEMIVEYGNRDTCHNINIYKYKNGKAVKVAKTKIYMENICIPFYEYCGHNGVIVLQEKGGYEYVSTMALKGNKLVIKKYGKRKNNTIVYYSDVFNKFRINGEVNTYAGDGPYPMENRVILF